MNEKKYYLGVDIGGTAVKIGLVEDNGTVLCQETYPDNFDQYKTQVLDTVVRSTELFLDEHKISTKDLMGIGISATGLIDEKSGVVIGAGDHIPNWNGSCIKERMTQRFQIPVTVINDANCAALGEFFIGAAKDVANVIVVTVGTGIGGGIIVNSQLLMGAQGLSGEIGNIVIHCDTKNGEQRFGYYEKYAATTALVGMVTEGIQTGFIKGMDDMKVNGKTIFEELGKKNAELEEVVDQWMDYVAAGLIGLVHIFNPDLILIGGGVSAQKELFVDRVKEKVLAEVFPAYRDKLRIEPAALGNNAGMVGAVYYCMEQMGTK